MKYFERRQYNDQYAETGNLNILNGYRQTDYHDIPDYRTVVYLLRHLLKKLPHSSIESIVDIGCGNGLLLAFIRESLGTDIIPYGYEYNPVAIEVLKTKVFPQFAENFSQKDVDTLTHPIDQDVALIMHGDYDWNRLSVTSPHLIVRMRIHLEDHPMEENRKQAIIKANAGLEQSKRLKMLETKKSSYRHTFRLYENLNNGEPLY